MKLRESTKSDYKNVRKLYKRAFPLNERAPFSLLRIKDLQNKATTLIAEDNGEFIGFTYTVCYENLVYLFYFAVDDDKRGRGYGSAILNLLKDFYSGKKIFLAREPLDEKAENNQQRIDRRKFYIKNGFSDMPYQIKEGPMKYDIMSTDTNFNPKDYNKLIKRWAGKFITGIIKMEIVE